MRRAPRFLCTLPQQAFYENVVRGVISRAKGEPKEPLYTQVAVIPCVDSFDGSNSGEYSSTDERFPPRSPAAGGGTPLANGDVREEPLRHSDSSHHSGGGSAGSLECVGGGSRADSAWQGRGEGDDVEIDASAGRGPGSVWPPVDVNGHLGVGGADGNGSFTKGVWSAARGRREKIVGLITCQVNAEVVFSCVSSGVRLSEILDGLLDVSR